MTGESDSTGAARPAAPEPGPRLWLDAHLPPQASRWLTQLFAVTAESLIDLGLHTLEDAELFRQSRAERVALVTKDADFVTLLRRHGPPPQIILLTCGNTSNVELRRILTREMARVIDLLHAGESLVEIGA